MFKNNSTPKTETSLFINVKRKSSIFENKKKTNPWLSKNKNNSDLNEKKNELSEKNSNFVIKDEILFKRD